MDDFLRIVLEAVSLVLTLRLLVRALNGLALDFAGLIGAFRNLRKLF